IEVDSGLAAKGVEAQIDDSSPARQHAVPPRSAFGVEDRFQTAFGGVVERSTAEVVPAVFLAQAVQHLDGVVGSKLLGKEMKFCGRHRVEKQIMQSASNAIDRTVLRLRENDASSKDSA